MMPALAVFPFVSVTTVSSDFVGALVGVDEGLQCGELLRETAGASVGTGCCGVIVLVGVMVGIDEGAEPVGAELVGRIELGLGLGAVTS